MRNYSVEDHAVYDRTVIQNMRNVDMILFYV